MLVAEATMELLIVALLLFTATTVSAAPSPSSQSECTAVIFNMVDCVPYLKTGSAVKKPDPLCCRGLTELLKEDFSCACEALNSSISLGAMFDRNRASSLTSACGLDGPPLSKCKIQFASGDGESPSGSPISGPEASDPEPPGRKHAGAPSPSSSSAVSAVATGIGAIVVSLFWFCFI